jgi:hypothetical protein
LPVRLPCKVFPVKDGSYIYSAPLNVSIALPDKNAPRTKRFEAIVDSGATRCVFNAEIGRYIGLKIEAGTLEETIGIDSLSKVYVHEISLYVPGGPIVIKAGFMEGLRVPGLLGMNGFFENFIVKFDISVQTFEIDRVHRA